MPHFVSNRPHGGMTALGEKMTNLAELTQPIEGGCWQPLRSTGALRGRSSDWLVDLRNDCHTRDNRRSRMSKRWFHLIIVSYQEQNESMLSLFWYTFSDNLR